ncbi:MAG: VCBS repeat-containing protein [Bacteroidetes bacterium]|nr:VCBS repeat-containing protein [Bacteroidota bacterium]
MKKHKYINSNRNSLLLFILAILVGCNNKKQLFDFIPSKASGINFINRVEDTKDANILDYPNFYKRGGVSVGDIINNLLSDLLSVGNLKKNALYINRDYIQFEDITKQSGVGGNSDWTTVSVMVDLNSDGLLDIYVQAVVGISGFEDNELCINQGNRTFAVPNNCKLIWNKLTKIKTQ